MDYLNLSPTFVPQKYLHVWGNTLFILCRTKKKKQIKRIVAGGFGKYEGATGYIEFEYVADNKAGPGYAIYHFY